MDRRRLAGYENSRPVRMGNAAHTPSFSSTSLAGDGIPGTSLGHPRVGGGEQGLLARADCAGKHCARQPIAGFVNRVSSPARAAFVQAYGSTELDASLLTIPLVELCCQRSARNLDCGKPSTPVIGRVATYQPVDSDYSPNSMILVLKPT